MKNGQQYHLFFQRIQVNAPSMRVVFQLPGGYAFLLRRFHLIQPDFITIGLVDYIFPPVNVELTDGGGAIQWQYNAIPADLYSSPRRDGVKIKTEAAPADLSGFSINMGCPFKNRAKTLNLFYDVGENINIRLSGMEYNAAAAIYTPNYIDLAAEGVFLK